MKVLHCEGSSDDTFGVYPQQTRQEHFRDGRGGADYDNCASGEPIVFRIASGATAESMLVVGQYAPAPCGGWLIGVSPDDDADDNPIPHWPMRFDRSDRPYSPRLIIDAPDDVTVTHIPA